MPNGCGVWPPTRWSDCGGRWPLAVLLDSRQGAPLGIPPARSAGDDPGGADRWRRPASVFADVAGQHPRCDGSGAGDRRLRKRFAIGRMRIVADRGMISAETIAALEQRGLPYILGVHECTDKLVREIVLNDAAPFVPLTIGKRGKQTDYSAKSVTLAGTRYTVCVNHHAETDAAERTATQAALERQPKRQGIGRQHRLSPLPQDLG